MAAEGLAPHLPNGTEVGVLGYDSDFLATDEREIASAKWTRIKRAHLRLHVARFPLLSELAATTSGFIAKYPAWADFSSSGTRRPPPRPRP
jgi:ribose transport system substrate-binding protein